MGMEYELKFKANPALLYGVQQAFPGETVQYQMETTYYDTPRLELSNLHCTLRRRMENDRSVCTMKTPGIRGSRGEWEVECSHIAQALPMLLDAGAPERPVRLALQGVTPICGASFHRTAVTIRYLESVLELALDEGVLYGGRCQEPLCEIEVELKSGSRSDGDAFAYRLASEFGLEPEHASKFSRALALSREE